MSYLLDTHAMIWLLSSPARLSARAAAVILDESKAIFYSPLSFCEIAIKANLGKIQMIDGWQMAYASLLHDRHILPIAQSWQDSQALQALPMHHKDPFDRMLISLAITQRLAIISADSQMARYDIDVIW